jgi:beta-N-acetylhexosaminidase
MTQPSTLAGLALRVQMPAFPGTTLPDGVRRLVAEGLGGICLFGSNTAAGPDAVAALTRTLHDAGDLVVAVDEEGGDVTRLHARTGSPVCGPATLGALDDPAATFRTARAIGEELAATGVGLDLAPVADVNSNPHNPVIGARSFGAEPELVARHVAAWVLGIQSTGTSACVKHFPGHGDTHADSHRALPTLRVGRAVLEGRELPPFTAAVAAGVAAVMTSHILVPAVDPGRPATLSGPVLRVLRERLGFGGPVVSDALDMAGASGGGRGVPRAAVLAVAAGVDLLCLGPDKDVRLVRAVQDALVRAVRDGELLEERLAEAAGRATALARRPAAAQDEDLRPAPGPGWHRSVARRALQVEGVLPALAGARLVRVDTPPSAAAGEVPWGIPGTVVDAATPGLVQRVEDAAGGRPLVLQTREAHRHPQVVDLVTRLAGRAAGLLVVEWGWPGELPVAVPRVCTHGASVPAREAVEDLLRAETGRTP